VMKISARLIVFVLIVLSSSRTLGDDDSPVAVAGVAVFRGSESTRAGVEGARIQLAIDKDKGGVLTEDTTMKGGGGVYNLTFDNVLESVDELWVLCDEQSNYTGMPFLIGFDKVARGARRARAKDFVLGLKGDTPLAANEAAWHMATVQGTQAVKVKLELKTQRQARETATAAIIVILARLPLAEAQAMTVEKIIAQSEQILKKGASAATGP
jgi:hypothetical protein